MDADARSAHDARPPSAVATAAKRARADSGAADSAAAQSVDPPALLASLRQLMRLRTIAIAGQAAAVAIAIVLGIALRVFPVVAIIGVLVVANVLTAARLKRGAPTTHYEVAGHLALDLAAFSGLLLLSGGTANPFALLYLLHVVLIALLLPWRLAVAGTLVVVGSFALSFAFAAPLTQVSGAPLSGTLIAAGLWISFALTAAVTAWFVGSVVATLREHDRLLREAARRAANDEAVLRIGTLAAGAAHELGSPLTTMAVLVDEMRRTADSPARERDATILAAQIKACNQALANLGAAAGHTCAIGGGRAPLDRFLVAVTELFRALRPDQVLEVRWHGVTPGPEVFTDQSLQQAILILLNNAADASPDHVDVEGRWDAHWLVIAVGDRGSGVSAGNLEKLGRTFFTTKQPGKGTGLGLVLAASTVARLGGTIGWSNRPGGGLSAEIRLPLRGLEVKTS